MFRKLLKYDFKSITNIWLIMSATVLAMSVFAGFCVKDIIINTNNPDYFPWSVIGVMITYIAYIAFGIITSILVYLRFYKNFFSDEGYLTFTLPVKRSHLLLSKLINSLIWSAMTFIVLLIGVIIVLAISPDPEGLANQSLLSYIIRSIGTFANEYFSFSGSWMLIPYAIETIVALILLSASSYLYMYFCITVASVIAKKHKILVAIAMVYGSSIVISFLQMILSISLPFWMISATGAMSNIPSPSNFELLGLVFLGLLLVCVIVGLVFWLMWTITLHCIERKLNLA